MSAEPDARMLAEAVRRYMEEGNASLRSQLAAFNRLRVVCGQPPLRLIEDRRAA